MLVITLLILSCSKKEDEMSKSITTDYNNMLLYQGVHYGMDTFSIDVDNDLVNDMDIIVHNFYPRGTTSFIKLSPTNGYKMACVDYITTKWYSDPTMSDTSYFTDTILIPQVYKQYDTISNFDTYTTNPLTIYYDDAPHAQSRSEMSGLSYKIYEHGDFYLGFRNFLNNKLRLVYVKFNNPEGSSDILLIESTFQEGKEYLKID